MTREDTDPGPIYGFDDTGLIERQRSPRTDSDMRDGDSGRGNPLEAGPTEFTTDNDVGDTRPTAADSAPEAPPVGTTELDRSREEVVGAGPSVYGSRPGEGGSPLPGYQQLTVPEIIRQAGSLSVEQLRGIKDFEKSHRRRKTLLTKLERMLRDPNRQ